MVHKIKVYEEKIHKELENDNMRNKILEGSIKRSDDDDNNVCKFLKLLKQLEELRNIEQCNLINIKEQKITVKKVKKRSILSIYFHGNYVMCKYVLINNRITELLVT